MEIERKYLIDATKLPFSPEDECMSSALPSQARIHPHLKVCCKNHPCPDAKKASNESPSSHLAQIHQVLDKRENHRDLRF